MTPEKILEVIRIYRLRFERDEIPQQDYPHESLLSEKKLGLAHGHAMLDKIVGFVEEGRMEKAFRWLGFIQGMLWFEGIYTLDDLKNHNRPRVKHRPNCFANPWRTGKEEDCNCGASEMQVRN